MRRWKAGLLTVVLFSCSGKATTPPASEQPPASFFAPAPVSAATTKPADAKPASSSSATVGAGPTALTGCPAVAVTQGYGRLKVTLGGDVLFDSGKHVLKPAAQQLLATIKRTIIDEHPKGKLVIEGHTDSVGEDDYNLRLSSQRAGAVVSWLVGKGISAPRISKEGHGERFPHVPNDTAENRAKNRRVELVIIDDITQQPPTIGGTACKGALACCQLAKKQPASASRCVGKTQAMDYWGADLTKHKLTSSGGALSLAACTKTLTPAIWITSTSENKIAKLDERDGREIFRMSTHGRFPHRTAVAQDGSVWVTNRNSGSYVHISPGGELLCSSRYKTCMTRAAAVDSDGNAWIGCYSKGLLIKVDPHATDGTTKVTGEAGEIEVPRCKELARVQLKGVSPYGLVADGRGTLWTCCGGNLAHVDAGSATVIKTVRIKRDPAMKGKCWSPYGIAIDRDGNPWYANNRCGSAVKIDGRSGKVLVYAEPPRFKLPPEQIEKIEKRKQLKEERRRKREEKENKTKRVAPEKPKKPQPKGPPKDDELPDEYFERKPKLRAVGIDLNGHAWLPDNGGQHVYEFASDGRFVKRVALSGCGKRGLGALGTGSDSEGHLWTVLQSRGLVAEYTTDGKLLGCYNKDKKFSSPYTYSDFTGSSMRMAANNDGRIVTRLWHPAALQWRLVTLRAVTPVGTTLCLRARAGCGRDLTAIKWSRRHCISSRKVATHSWSLNAAQLPKAPVLEIELELGSSIVTASPIIYDLSAAGTP